MKVFKGFLLVFLGMIIGIILFVVAFGGAIYALTTSMTVGEFQNNYIKQDIIDQNSQIFDQSIFNAVKKLIQDIKNPQNLSLKTLYEIYGVRLLNGIGGIDFTQKDFYTSPITEVINNPSVILNSLTLNDISIITNRDLSDYNIPVLMENLDKSVSVAIDNILSSVNGNLTVRTIKDKLGIDIGTEDNFMIEALQDASLSSIGSVINSMYLNTLLQSDNDTFIKKGENPVYVKVDIFEEVSQDTLDNSHYTAPLGVETYISGINDDGTLDIKELRYVKTETSNAGEQFTVDNSCYGQDTDTSDQKTFYRHIQYAPYNDVLIENAQYFIPSYYNRIKTYYLNDFCLIDAGFQSLSDIYVLSENGLISVQQTVNSSVININEAFYFNDLSEQNCPEYAIADEILTKDSKLRVISSDSENSVPENSDIYLLTHSGTSSPIVQTVALLTVSELQNAEDLLSSLTVGDIVDIDSNTSILIRSLKDSNLKTIGEDINNLTVDQIIDLESEDTSTIMRSLAARGCTINDLGSIVNSLSVGEIFDIDYDVYSEKADGFYTTREIYVPYNPYFHGEAPLYSYNSDTEEYVPCDFGEGNSLYVKITTYCVYDENIHGPNALRYDRESEGTTSKILQSLARRGTPLSEINTSMDNLYVDELLAIDQNSSIIMQSLSKRDVIMGKFDTVVDDLRIDEVVKIDDNSSKLMRSLALRGCTISQLSTISDELTLGEMTDIICNVYTQDENGDYVLVTDDNAYVIYDASLSYSVNLVRYEKLDDGTYVENANGEYVKSHYFTLYNPAVHGSDVIRYNETQTENASSKLLQRFANTTFSATQFDDIILADVMDIDADTYLAVNEEYVSSHPQNDYFYYDAENSIYKRWDKNGEQTQLYTVVKEGTNSAIIKRLAYTKVNSLSDSMENILKDILVSELVDINMNYSVYLSQDNSVPSTSEEIQNAKYLIRAAGIDDEGRAYTYVFDSNGRYMLRPYELVQTSLEDMQSYVSQNTYFKYVEITNAEDFVQAVSEYNVYYKHSYSLNGEQAEEYVYNLPLCVYLVSQSPASFPSGKLYKRVSAQPTDTDAIEAQTYSHSQYLQNDIFVNINGNYLPYDASNIAHHNLENYYIYKNEYSVVSISQKGIYSQDEDDYSYVKNGDILLSKRYCDDVYIADDEGQYVYIGGKYISYEESIHSGHQRYRKETGYIASFAETFFYNSQTQSYETYFNNQITLGDGDIMTKVDVEREQSVPVLRYFAKENVTVENMNNVIQNATISDIMDIDPNSILARFSNGTLANLDTLIENELSSITIGELIEWAAITNVEPVVKEALKSVSLSDFFESLKYNASKGIYVDMEVAMGYA